MGPASKTSCNTSTPRIGEVDAVVKFEPKKEGRDERRKQIAREGEKS